MPHDSKEERWSRGDRIGAAGIVISLIGLIAAFSDVPEIRRALRLDDSTIDLGRRDVASAVFPVADAPNTASGRTSAVPKPSQRIRSNTRISTTTSSAEAIDGIKASEVKREQTKTDEAKTVTAEASTDDPLARDYNTNFAYGMSEWAFYRFGSWSETAKWTLVNDSGIALELAGGVQWGGGNYIAVVPETRRRNGRVSARVKIADVRNDGHHSGLIARYQDIDNFYELFLNRPSGSLHLSKWVAGQEKRLASVALPMYMLKDWVHLALICDGTRIVGLIDGREVVSAVDGTHTRGAFGLFNGGGATRYQNFAVSPHRL
jgi:hypothetical protein